jgi:hypothetical protein
LRMGTYLCEYAAQPKRLAVLTTPWHAARVPVPA